MLIYEHCRSKYARLVRMDINFMNKGRKYENGETSNQRSVMARIHNPRQPPTASATLLHCVFTPFERQSQKNAKNSKKYLIETKDDYKIQPAFKRTVQLKILCSNEVSWSRNGARCLSNTSCGPKSAPKTPPKYWGGKRR